MNRFTKIVLGVVALALVVGVAAPVKAQTIDINSLLAQIAALQAQLAALQGGSSTASAMYTMDLGVGSRGAEVTALQNKLGVVPATGYFGPLTKAAVQKYQASKGISATGFVGPLTRAALNAGSTTTTTTTTPVVSTTGVEGTLTVSLNPTPAAGTKVYEADSMASVLGLKLEAKLSDIRVERIKINLGSSTNVYNKVFSKIYVTDGSTVVASSDLNSSTVVKEGSNYYITLTGMNVVVPKDGTKVLTVKADVKSTVGSYTGNYTFALPTDGVRGTDGAGINQYGGDSSVSRTVDVNTILADSATLKISTGSNTPVSTMIIAADGSANDEKDAVTLLTFTARAEKDAVTINEINNVTITKTGSGTATTTTAELYVEGQSLPIASATVTGGDVDFNDEINYTIPANSEVKFTLKADIADADTTSATFTASVTTGANIVAENASGTTLATGNKTGSATGNPIIVLSEGPEFTLVSKSIAQQAAVDQVASSTLTGQFSIKIKAVGGDVYFGTQSASTTFSFKPYRSGAVFSTTAASSTTWDIPSSGVVTSGLATGQAFKLQENNEITIPVTFVVDGKTSVGATLGITPTSLGLEAISWSLGGAETISTFMSGRTEWRTDAKTF